MWVAPSLCYADSAVAIGARGAFVARINVAVSVRPRRTAQIAAVVRGDRGSRTGPLHRAL